ncbi:Spliceosomal U1 snRNP protein, putative [Candida maltosa Xu316]|uniref:Spliceosomal U1 snRNP protein, putative n=1 Tax=Candida maltosa (strain Xu316) TaxID=1245528 RepID=M3HTX2_CANMX|nr:Spliceosomal U1 snRNP protein, putative [Candida maltosa Xu316]
MNKNLPVDLNDDLHELLLDNEDEDVKVIVQEIHKSPNDLTKWNKLLHHQSITTNEDLLNKSYKKLLSRFPYLESHWIEWSNHEYNFNGLNGKKKILQLAVENFRQSVKLWTEFLRVYLEDTSSVNVDEFRELYKLAISSNGHNFNSHPIWDLIIEYETTNKNSDAVLEIYLQLIKIPLYQYSKYFNDFKTISKEFHLKQIIPSDELADYIKQLSSSEKSEDELSVIDKYQILNTFISTKFNQIQQKVEEFWKYESAIENFDFNIDLINSTTLNNDLKIWNNYIDSVVDQYTKTPDNDELYKIIINLYERCLIPNVYNSQVWLKFIEFINKQGDDEAKFNKINEIYMKINSRIIPIDDNSTRFKYVDYLIEQKKPQQANEYLFDWIKLTSKSNNYHKASYLESIKKLVGIWEEMLSPSQFVKILETLIYNYFNIHSDKHMKTSEEPKEEKEDGDDSTFKLSDSFITSFSVILF